VGRRRSPCEPPPPSEIEGEGFGGVALLLEHESVLLLEHERHGCTREHPCLHLFRVFLIKDISGILKTNKGDLVFS